MATRRRYAPPKYRDGGAVPISPDAPVAPQVERAQEMMSVSADEPQPASFPDDALRQAIEGQRRAEEMQRQAPRPVTIDDHIAAMPISEFKKDALRAHPELLHEAARGIASEAYQEALAAGIADDTPAMTAFMVSAVRSEMEERRQRLADAARSAVGRMMQPPPIPEPDIERAVERLDREAQAYLGAYQAEHSTPLAMSDQIAAMAPPPPPPRRSMPITAPVTRDVPTASGRRFTADQTTLTPEERHVARHSFTDPNLTNVEKERLYLQNKIKLAQERAAGRYPMPERN